MAVKVAKTVGFGSAVFCGKIAALPFKTVWYMGETASYGIRSLKGADHHDKGLATMDQQYEATALQEYTLESKSRSEHSMQNASSDNQVDQRLVEMIGMLQRKRGTEDKRFMDPDFGRMIVSEFEVLCRPSWK
ncbi:uncharacterized protein ASPGLDRAFT_48296 [Aspergillus glaucus CBS 516.65]|uniref:Uncharacterized protein n=1 Tax=Aspergillus glaucus CBS 516.65 TaxID=1160497 RepID=A0A1L9VGE0_ASPGL|nr:hypothetical protein ASPGLDRAFT_48296 [Aspergillus glaucus CBS 516.65]OJJ82969.1 hypothetical protein ASPGLDRAFT_48296 [Aspergillus glaucus CBS 516.65]